MQAVNALEINHDCMVRWLITSNVVSKPVDPDCERWQVLGMRAQALYVAFQAVLQAEDLMIRGTIRGTAPNSLQLLSSTVWQRQQR